MTSVLSQYADNAPSNTPFGRLARRLGLPTLVSSRNDRTLHGHIKARELARVLPKDMFEHFFKFAFVRNPWDWQVSLYHFALGSNTHFQHQLIKSMRNFDEYIEWRVSKDRKLQKDFVTDENGNLIMDFIGRYERLEEDFEHICKVLSITTALPHLNKSLRGDYRRYYNPRTRGLVAKYFKEDIELFGYTFD